MGIEPPVAELGVLEYDCVRFPRIQADNGLSSLGFPVRNFDAVDLDAGQTGVAAVVGKALMGWAAPEVVSATVVV